MGGVDSAGIFGVFGGGVREMVLVGGLEVILQVDSRLVYAGFLAPALPHGLEVADRVH